MFRVQLYYYSLFFYARSISYRCDLIGVFFFNKGLLVFISLQARRVSLSVSTTSKSFKNTACVSTESSCNVCLSVTHCESTFSDRQHISINIHLRCFSSHEYLLTAIFILKIKMKTFFSRSLLLSILLKIHNRAQ